MRGVRYYKISLLIILSISSLLYAINTNKVYAEDSGIIISELMYDPEGSDSGYEWIELLNTSDESINLNDWEIQVAGTTYSTVFEFESINLAPKEILLIGESQIENSDISVETLGFQNGGSCTDAVRLINSNNKIIDIILYDEPDSNNLGSDEFEIYPDIKSGNSIARIEDPLGSYQTYENVNPNPGEKSTNQINAEFEIDSKYLTNQDILLDASNSTSNISEIETYEWIIKCPEETYEFEEKSASLEIEGAGICSIKLTVKDALDFSSEVSKKIEIVDESTNIEIITIENLKNVLPDNEVTVQGQITTPTNLISEKEYYLQDGRASIRLRSPDQMLEYGKHYQITGNLDHVYGEIRFVANEIETINLDHQIDTHPQDISNIENITPGLLIKITGLVKTIKGNYLYILTSKDSENTQRIYIPDSLGIQDLKQFKDKTITVTGIVSQYGTNTDSSPKLRIVPLSPNNIKITNQSEILSETGQAIVYFYFMGFLALLISRHLKSHLLNSISN